MDDSMTWTLCFSNLIQRIGLILMTPRLEASFYIMTQRIVFWKTMTQRIEPSFSDVTQRIEPFLHDSKNWTVCQKKQKTQRIEVLKKDS